MTAVQHPLINIAAHDAWAAGPPHEQFAWLRANAPVFRHERAEEDQPEWFWALTRHADIVTASRQFQNYSSAARGAILALERPDLEFARMLIDLDPPDHTRLRTIVSKAFTPKSIRQLGDKYRAVSIELVDEAIAEGEVDFVTKVAAELPLIAIAEMLGVPVEDRSKVFEWSNTMIGTSDAEYSGGPEAAQAAAMELYMYANSLAADRRENPRDDIITTLITAEGEQLTGQEFELFVLLLSVAGNETTRNAISHSINHLIQFPGAFAEMKAQPEVLDTAVEELLRWATPVNVFQRTATCDLELDGTLIHEGERVAMYYMSANFDDAVFDDPFRFDIHRSPNPHLAFGGGGPHFCLGAQLARLEMKVLFEELLPRISAIEPAGDLSRLRSNFINGIKHLPVRLVAA